MEDLSSAAVPPLRLDDHLVGGAGPDSDLVIVYADFTCPHCAVTWQRLRAEGARIAFRHFALKAKHPRAIPLGRAAEAAAAQGAFAAFADSLYADQGRIDDPHLWARCEALGLDLERFDDDRRAEASAERVRRDTREGMRAGVIATPALFA